MVHPLKAYRDREQVTAASLAARAGTSRQTIHRIESGQFAPSLDLLARIVTATDGSVSADDFLGWWTRTNTPAADAPTHDGAGADDAAVGVSAADHVGRDREAA